MIKLYTEEQVRQAWNTAYIDALALDEDDYKPNFYDDFIKTITPIELPSDDEIKEAVENKFGLVDPILGKSDYRMGYESGLIKGVKWMKEKILNQNK